MVQQRLPRDASQQQVWGFVSQLFSHPISHRFFLALAGPIRREEQDMMQTWYKFDQVQQSSQKQRQSRMWLQFCLVLNLLKGVGSTVLSSAPCQAHPQWNRQGTYRQSLLCN